MQETIEMLLGNQEHITFWQLGLRAFLGYLFIILLLRHSERRSLGKQSATDIILGIILGSMASEGICGSAPFFPTMFGCATIVGMHYALSWIAHRSDRAWKTLNGEPCLLIENGRICEKGMRAAHFSRNDLLEGLRMAEVERPEEVKLAYLESNGEVTVIKQEKELKVSEEGKVRLQSQN